MSTTPPRPPPPPARRQLWLAVLCRRWGVTVRGIWVLLVAVGVVGLSAAGSYVFVFPTPTGGAPAIAALGAGVGGFPLLVAGVCGLATDRRGPLCTPSRGERGGGS